MTGTPFLGVDWGTRALRARLFDSDGTATVVRAERVVLADLDHAGIVDRIVSLAAAWPEAAAGGLLLSGMVGSASGWAELPRVPCPADPAAVAAHAHRTHVGDIAVTFLPGLSCRNRFGDADVLRGEELIAVGLIAMRGNHPATLLAVPGMHGKWLRLRNGAVHDFHSAPTVELHGALARETALAPLMRLPVGPPGDAFRRGVRRGAREPGLGRLLFAARSAVQAGEMPAEEAGAWLWGVLIGSDLRDGVDDLATPHLVAGSPEIADLFADGLEVLGVAAERVDDDAVTAAGFRHLATRLVRR